MSEQNRVVGGLPVLYFVRNFWTQFFSFFSKSFDAIFVRFKQGFARTFFIANVVQTNVCYNIIYLQQEKATIREREKERNRNSKIATTLVEFFHRFLRFDNKHVESRDP
mgnify:CR=1 FL=1